MNGQWFGVVSAVLTCLVFSDIRENFAGCEDSYESREARIPSRHGVTF